ncbi:hypothetical protein [Algoriphagus resistens]|uniref:hypothetical protein n=1 Tax=Algoriphagus resistens TaxID=1750590 RepID=UPI00071678E1|nr:hypothetical protein [Algoriphagus resistens]
MNSEKVISNRKLANTFYFTTFSTLTDIIEKNTSVADFKVSFMEGLIYKGIMGMGWIGEKKYD